VLEFGLGLVLGVMRAMKIGVDIGELDLAARVDLQPLGEIHGDFPFCQAIKDDRCPDMI